MSVSHASRSGILPADHGRGQATDFRDLFQFPKPYVSVTYTYVPEPGSMALVAGLGLLGFGLYRRLRV